MCFTQPSITHHASLGKRPYHFGPLHPPASSQRPPGAARGTQPGPGEAVPRDTSTGFVRGTKFPYPPHPGWLARDYDQRRRARAPRAQELGLRVPPQQEPKTRKDRWTRHARLAQTTARATAATAQIFRWCGPKSPRTQPEGGMCPWDVTSGWDWVGFKTVTRGAKPAWLRMGDGDSLMMIVPAHTAYVLHTNA